MTVTRIPLAERFWTKVGPETVDGCWPWTAHCDRDGYGTLHSGTKSGRSLRAHRVAYELIVGPIPTGLVIDHLCRNRGCVNPAHMEPVTPGENTRRGMSPSVEASRRGRCEKGHEFDVTSGPRSQRFCKECKRERDAASQARRRERGHKPPHHDPPPSGDPRHGLTGYGDPYRCRCDICRAAWAGYQSRRRDERAELLAAGLIVRPHGTVSTYLNYRCRCSECRNAQAAYDEQRKAKRATRQAVAYRVAS